ncbi:MAG: helix-turn-helix domain-containing protein [Propionibacteriaceae bacterium]|jgi:excisionase family DNA binding protein|nr:helix-turn-helix domain-containing protein [Propionibacteriaceae bacterium]
MSTQVLTLQPEAIRHTDTAKSWAEGLVKLVDAALRAGETVVVSTETKTLTPDELAQRLMVSRSTISRRIKAGEIAVIKVGNRNRIPYSEAYRLRKQQMEAMMAASAADIEAELFGDDE